MIYFTNFNSLKTLFGIDLIFVQFIKSITSYQNILILERLKENPFIIIKMILFYIN